MKVFISSLLLIIPIAFLFVNHAYSSSIEDKVYPADSKILGLTYKQWSPKFWQWWVSLPNAKNATTASGETDAMHDKCFMNNNSPVIFLANPIIGAFVFDNTAVTYECTIPHDKPILVVGIDEMCNYNAAKENDPSQVIKTDQELQDCVHARNPYASVTFMVDNQSIKVPSEKNENGHSPFSLTTDYFNITIPNDSMVADWATGTNRALIESKLIILKPLPVGDHTIGVKTVQITPNEEDRLDLDMKYLMHVK
jgi:hypothetical protein